MQPAEFHILAINPGSTSTKIAVYVNERAEWVQGLNHAEAEMEPFRGRPILDQLDFRRARIEAELTAAGYALDAFDAVAGRGGLMRPIASGTYRVNEAMLADLRVAAQGEHASTWEHSWRKASRRMAVDKRMWSIPSAWMSSAIRRGFPALRLPSGTAFRMH